MPRFTTTDVQHYYDRQTNGFLTHGQGGSLGAIHRAVWGPGARDRTEAFHYVEDRIAGFIADLDGGTTAPHVVDLGCGVGASLCYLATQLPIRASGITLSPVQMKLATAGIAAKGLTDRVVCLRGDYCDLPPLAPADFAYAIESFVHCQDPDRFFAECRRILRPGGQLAICDDFRAAITPTTAESVIERFCAGWNINALLRLEELQAIAARSGFEVVTSMNLSTYLEIHRARDRAIDVFLAVFGWLPLHLTPIAHLAGGSALQTCLQQGWIDYQLALFRRMP